MGKSNKFSLTTKSHSSTRVNPYDKITLNALNVTCPDKQIVLPRLDKLGAQQVHIELYSFLIFIIALGTQYLNLYRSVWWLSKNNNHRNNQQQPSPINYHLIDFDASQFSFIFIGQSFLISCLRFLTNLLTLPPPQRSSSGSTSSPSILSLSLTSWLCYPQGQHNNNNNNNSSSSCFNSHTTNNLVSPTCCSSSASTCSSTSSCASSTVSSSSLISSTLSSATQLSNCTSTQQSTYFRHHQNSTTKHHQNQQQTTSQQQQHHQQKYHNHHHNASPGPISHDGNGNDSGQTVLVTATFSWICTYFLFKSAYRIWNNFGLNGVSCISYPILISIIMNSAHIIQVFEGCRKTGKLNLSFLTISMTLFSSHIKFDDEKLCHNCHNQAEGIRDEVERLRTIFNERLKFVLYKSVLLAYYSSFVPLCFAQSFLYYDYSWTAQHVIITWFSSLIMLITSSYTPHFYDVLHRSAYHFGKWQKLGTRNTLVPCINWSENMIYPQGIVVKHYKGYFRSESVSNCAQPGVSSHLCYYIVFSNPRIGYVTVLVLLGILLTVQMYLLLVSTEWYKLIAMTNMMLINIHSIFRLVKSLVVITNIYKKKH